MNKNLFGKAFISVSITLLLTISLFKTEAQSTSKIKIACIGASITYGATIFNREENCYPAQLQKMLGKASRSSVEFDQFKKDFSLDKDEQVMNFKGSPVDKINQIAEGKYPVLILCADADEAVPPEENTLLFEQKMKEQNGKVEVIHKPGYKHHRHSLPNPAPIDDFILQAVNNKN